MSAQREAQAPGNAKRRSKQVARAFRFHQDRLADSPVRAASTTSTARQAAFSSPPRPPFLLRYPYTSLAGPVSPTSRTQQPPVAFEHNSILDLCSGVQTSPPKAHGRSASRRPSSPSLRDEDRYKILKTATMAFSMGAAAGPQARQSNELDEIETEVSSTWPVGG